MTLTAERTACFTGSSYPVMPGAPVAATRGRRVRNMAVERIPIPQVESDSGCARGILRLQPATTNNDIPASSPNRNIPLTVRFVERADQIDSSRRYQIDDVASQPSKSSDEPNNDITEVKRLVDHVIAVCSLAAPSDTVAALPQFRGPNVKISNDLCFTERATRGRKSQPWGW